MACYGRDLIGEFWRMEITLRQLRVARDHLPPDSAWHRAQPDYHQWGNTEGLLWVLAHLLERLDARLVWHAGRKPRWPKFRMFPWDKASETVGNRDGFTHEQVMAYLKSKAPANASMLKDGRWRGD